MFPEKLSTVAGAALVVALVTLAPTSAFAAACCTSAGIGGVGRLTIWEKAAAGARLSVVDTRGRWDHEGEWTPSDDGYVDLELRTELWGMGRLSRRGAVYGSVPVARIVRGPADERERGAGIGDISVGWRHQLVEIGEFTRLPGVAFTLSVLAPTGRSTDDSTTTLATDVTGRGAWRAQAGVQVEWSVLPWFVQIEAGGAYHFPAERSDLGVPQRFGPSALGGVSAGVEVLPDLVFALTLNASREAALRIDHEVIENSEQTDLRAGLSGSWRFHPHWTVQAAATSGIFVDGLGDNRFGDITVTGGIRVGFF